VLAAVHVVTKSTRRVCEGDFYTTTKGLHTKTLKRENLRKFIYEVNRRQIFVTKVDNRTFLRWRCDRH